MDYADWKSEFEAVEMPGIVKQLTSVGDDLWAACVINRRWWQFWKPAESIQWFKVDLPNT